MLERGDFPEWLPRKILRLRFRRRKDVDRDEGVLNLLLVKGKTANAYINAVAGTKKNRLAHVPPVKIVVRAYILEAW